ncbi:MAG TPA: stimulus-sensing domain-containing protein, partial [Phenylobacterium sp.]
MASVTDTAKAERAPERAPERTEGRAQDWLNASTSRFRWLPGSRLGRLILALNLLGLAILIGGALVQNELRNGLVNARIDSLTTQGELIASILDQAATVGEPEPQMDTALATELLQTLANPTAQRARLFDNQGRLVADSDWMADRVEQRALPPAKARGDKDLMPHRAPPTQGEAARALAQEVRAALQGRHLAKMR